LARLQQQQQLLLQQQQQQQQVPLTVQTSQLTSPVPQLVSPKEGTAIFGPRIRSPVVSLARGYSPISSPDPSTQSSPPPPPVLLSPQSAHITTQGSRSRNRRRSPSREPPQERMDEVCDLSTGRQAKENVPSTSSEMESDGPAGPTTEPTGGRGRGRRLLSCPLCGAEYALPSTLEKHIDRDHREENTAGTGRLHIEAPKRSGVSGI